MTGMRAGLAARARRNPEASGADTRNRILDAAERLFAERGYSGVSIRNIIDEAGVNIAAAHYHFGSKEAVLATVFRRRLEPINEERERLLATCIDAAGSRPDIAAVLTAFIEPTLRIGASEGERHFKLLSGRASTDPSPEVRRVLVEVYDAVARRFVEALRAACPDLSGEELFWRVACVYGAMMYIRADNGRLQHLFGPHLSLSDPAAALRYAVPFLTAGLNLPPAPASGAGGRRRPAARSRGKTKSDPSGVA